MFPGGMAYALPHGAVITSGRGFVTTSGSNVTVNQLSGVLNTNWSSFNVWKDQSVKFIQPNSSALAINTILGNSASKILGNISANGHVWLINPNGVLFGNSAVVNTRGFLASALNLSSLNANPTFSGGSSNAQVSNAGNINGNYYLALIGPSVSNSGTLSGKTVSLLSGSNLSLTFVNDNLLSYQINASTLPSLVNNTGKIQANGGSVWLAAGAKNSIVESSVNDSGIIDAQTIGTKTGSIVLLSGMTNGTTTVSGTLNASAQTTGNGGTIDTSGNRVNIHSGAIITTKSSSGETGIWTLDPSSFYIGENTGSANSTSGNITNYEDISGTNLSNDLASNNIVIDSTQGTKGNLGNVYVDTSVSWNSSNSLTLNAVNNINVNKSITNTGTGDIVLRSDDMDIGGVAGTGNVNVASGVSVETAGNLSVYTNGSYLSALTDPTTGVAYTNSAGTLTAYNLISSISDLEYLSNNQTTQSLANNYALNTNTGWATNTTYNFTPIGDTTAYSGTFNGLDHTITNLYESRTYLNEGLFNTNIGTIKNVGIINPNLIGTGTADTGGVAGINTGNVFNSWTIGGNMSNDSSISGGLVGLNSGSIENSYDLRTYVYGSYVGGIVGNNTGSIFYSNASASLTGYVAGGIAGEISGSIYDSYTGSGTFATALADLGGLVGVAFNGGLITNSYSSASISGASYVGGLVGSNYGSTIKNSYATGSIPGNFTGGTYYGGGLVGENCVAATIQNSYATNGNTGSGNFVGYNTGTINGNTNLSTNLNNLASTATTWSWNTSTWNNGYSNISTYPWLNRSSGDPILIPAMGIAKITASSANMTYSGKTYTGTPSSSITTTMGATTPGGSVSFNGSYSNAVNVGGYSITPTMTLVQPTSQNMVNSLVVNDGLLTITPATLTVTANASQKTYGTTNPTLSGTVSGLVNGQTLSGDGGSLTFSTPATSSSPAGTYAITGSLTLPNPYASDYTIIEAKNNLTALTIDPAKVVPNVVTLAPIFKNSTLESVVARDIQNTEATPSSCESDWCDNMSKTPNSMTKKLHTQAFFLPFEDPSKMIHIPETIKALASQDIN